MAYLYLYYAGLVSVAVSVKHTYRVWLSGPPVCPMFSHLSCLSNRGVYSKRLTNELYPTRPAYVSSLLYSGFFLLPASHDLELYPVFCL